MIIRSQYKKVIANFDNIDSIGIEQNHCGCDVVVYNGTQESCVKLGEYSTEEKAIKVLDMICEEYAKYTSLEDCLGGVHGIHVLPKCFQMPKDNEVEV